VELKKELSRADVIVNLLRTTAIAFRISAHGDGRADVNEACERTGRLD